MQWRHSGSPPPKKFRVQKSAVNFSPRFFGIETTSSSFDYLPKGQTINTEYYESLLVELTDILNEKRRGIVTKGVFFLHDIVRAHRALATQKKQAYLGFQCLDHPPCAPYVASSD
jgi:hypothetical protein